MLESARPHNAVPALPRASLPAAALMLALAGGCAGVAAADPPEPSTTPATPAPPQDSPTARPGSDAQKLERIEVTGPKSDIEERRLSTAAKIVIGREEIERFGDSTLDEVLKRLPSITIFGRARRGGGIAMRGMGSGYTQILINGERIPPGLSIDQLIPDQVERIEIYRAPTAETGSRAIAGTINIVLREALRIYLDDVHLQEGVEANRLQSNFSWIRNDILSERGTYNFALSVAHVDFFTPSSMQTVFRDTTTGEEQLEQNLDTTEVDHRDNLHFTSRFQWKLPDGEQWIIQPFFNFSKIQTRIDGQLDQTVGLLPAPYATSTTGTAGQTELGRIQGQWQGNLFPGLHAELHAYVGDFQSDTATMIDEETIREALALTQFATTDINDRSWQTSGKLSTVLFGAHSLVGGWEIEDVQRAESASTLQNGVSVLAAFGSDLSASVLRTAAYLQDEWDPFPQWSANAGLRWEGIDTRSQSAQYNVSNDSSVLTPLAHAVWRFDPPDKDQFRISLTRSYRAPSLNNLVGLPTLSTLYPVTESNVASSPDKAGNPELKPEIARGIDLALEHYTGRESVASVSFFARKIQDLMRTVTDLEDVPWSAFPRWVARPRNIGDASTRGIEFDEKVSLPEVMPGAPAVTLRSNFSVYRSDVEGIFGPYNKINQQPIFQSNSGFDWKLPELPWQVGGNISWTPPYTIQSTDTQSSYFGVRRIIDFYGLWTVRQDMKLRFSISNLSPHQYLTSTDTIQGNQSQTVTTVGPTTTLFAVRLELKL